MPLRAAGTGQPLEDRAPLDHGTNRQWPQEVTRCGSRGVDPWGLAQGWQCQRLEILSTAPAGTWEVSYETTGTRYFWASSWFILPWTPQKLHTCLWGHKKHLRYFPNFPEGLHEQPYSSHLPETQQKSPQHDLTWLRWKAPST